MKINLNPGGAPGATVPAAETLAPEIFADTMNDKQLDSERNRLLSLTINVLARHEIFLTNRFRHSNFMSGDNCGFNSDRDNAHKHCGQQRTYTHYPDFNHRVADVFTDLKVEQT